MPPGISLSLPARDNQEQQTDAVLGLGKIATDICHLNGHGVAVVWRAEPVSQMRSENTLLVFGVMVGGCWVPKSNPRRNSDPASGRSARVRRVRFWLRLLAAYAVAIVNGVALVYITIRLLFAGVRWLFHAT
jgi:hypothetical protein